jgi:hypothetical protein
MVHLTDMEELVSSVQKENIRDYMSEALACYMAGAYRASVVLTFIALFDDIVAKLGELGKVNKKAKIIFDAATQKRSDQDVFETYLIDQLKANSLLASLDAGFLDILRTLRNKAAHPSGHHASAEEARFVIFEAVSRFLSKPILSTTQLAEEILESLSNANLFPSVGIDVITKVVEKELENIHLEAYPYLILKLLERTQSNDAETSKNARFFLTGMARTKDVEALAVLRKYAVEKTASNKSYISEIISLLCSNGALFTGLDELTYQRLGVLIKEQIEKVELTVEHTRFSHPASLFVSLFNANSNADVLKRLGDEFEQFLERFTYSAFFASMVLPHKEPRDLLVRKLIEKAGSNDFNTANKFVKNADDIEKTMVSALLPIEAFRLLVNVIRAAEIGAFSAIDMRNSHFGAVSKLREKANEFLANDASSAKAIAEEVLGVEDTDDLLKALTPVEEVS